MASQMRRVFLVLYAVAALGILPFTSKAEEAYGAPPPNITTHLDRLVKSYPDWISGYDSEFLILHNGIKFSLSDKRINKTFEELVENPDIDDMFFKSYPVGKTPIQPPKNFDPGRVRFEPLFISMYGDCLKSGVVVSLRTIGWLPKHNGGRVTITKINSVDKALEAVSAELDDLPETLIKYVKPTAGTYNCRTIAGSRARSMHAYGAAIDINSKFSNYWRWASPGVNSPTWINQIPIEIVRIFERHGFIWGGYWYHYDTMHFEYRPELLPPLSELKHR
jgi:D-alanyl-D-alanine carboxypeptidase